jgi:aryl-alcohol dehydrogenase-like predicted oxidoreductase
MLNEQEDIDIPPEQKLQDYALQYVLKEPAFSQVIVGCTHPSEVLENVGIAKNLDSEDEP